MVDYDKLGTLFEGTGTFLKFSQTNPITGEFLGVEVVPNPFKKGPKDPDQSLQYTFVVDGVTKTLTSGSRRLYVAFKKAKAKEGDVITVERMGLGRDTDYSVDIVKK